MVGLSLHKTIVEVGGVEPEHAVIEHQVDLAGKVLITDSRMPEQRINLVSGSTRDQTELNAVANLLCTERERSAKQKQTDQHT